MKFLFLLSLILSCKILLIFGQSGDTTVSSTESITTTLSTTSSSTTLRDSTTSQVGDECFSLNSTCEDCLGNSKCFFCLETNSCQTYEVDGIFPKGCKASKSRWISCSLNFEALLIGLISGGVVILLIIGCCVCYCCNKTCKAISDRSMERFERKIRKQRDFIKQKNEERKKERQSRNDAIRIKYGLQPSTYSNLEE
ncbi:unnamed protein product [Brachionus calyciflorus]|uniref:Uncharacterized protein n=1 Tax=Brachionus calyciflorus TaxID=104777 RepID=A0A814KFJ6_9BILA|nr:unnamed protein product [Brachionus calyciflorus]